MIFSPKKSRDNDPYFSNTTLLVKSIPTFLGNTSFTDESQNGANNFGWGAYGNAHRCSFGPHAPTGYWSGAFDGTGDYLVLPYSSSFDLSTGDWTIECWFNSHSFASGQHLVSKDTYGTNFDWSILVTNATTIQLYTNGASVNLPPTVPR